MSILCSHKFEFYNLTKTFLCSFYLCIAFFFSSIRLLIFTLEIVGSAFSHNNLCSMHISVRTGGGRKQNEEKKNKIKTISNGRNIEKNNNNSFCFS